MRKLSMGMLLACAVSALALAPAVSAPASPPAAASAQQTPDYVSVSAKSQTLTLYLDGAVVEETRSLDCKDGPNVMQLQGMPAQYKPQTLLLESVAGPANGKFELDAVAYQAPNLNVEGLLSKSIGKQITVITGSAGGTVQVSGTLLNVSNGELIIQETDHTAIVPVTEYVGLDKTTPDGMSPTASLTLNAKCGGAGSYTIKILYQTGGLSWHPTHSIVYDPQTGTIKTFDSSVAITNNSGAAFNNVIVNMIAGDLPAGDQYHGRAMPAAMLNSAPGGAPEAAVPAGSFQSVGEQKMYTAPAPLSIAPGQMQQVPLFQAANVPVKQEYVFDASYAAGNEQATLLLHLVNDSQHHLGKPLPAGELRIYEMDKSGALQLMPTSARLQELAANEPFTINMGASSDIKGETLLNEVDQHDAKGNITARIETFQVTLHNYKSTDTKVTVSTGRDAKSAQVVSSTTTLHADKDGTLTSTVTVPKNGSVTVTFTLKTVVGQ